MPATYLNGRRWEDQWSTKLRPGRLAEDDRTEAEIAAANDEALRRIGGTHG
jgi:hypothetical protein